MAELLARLERWSQQGFLIFNASEHPAATTVAVANATAQRAIFLVPLLLAVLWLWGNPANRTGLLLAFCGAEIARAFNQTKVQAMAWCKISKVQGSDFTAHDPIRFITQRKRQCDLLLQ